MQTVISARAATTVGGIDIGICNESAEDVSGTRVGVINTCALRDWLTDIAGKYQLTAAACAVYICQYSTLNCPKLNNVSGRTVHKRAPI